MNSTLNAFEQTQRATIAVLQQVLDFLSEGEALGVNIDASLRNKIKKALEELPGDKLKVALIGGFSEGKTAIAAAWLEKLDKSSMKISHAESSDEVQIYDVGPKMQVIDTPGLFGFKEKQGESGAIEKYKDITKKYVSSAHLVLYVMNSTNPIKDSHKDDLVWLFRTLNLLPRTVFVLSRFDEVADVEDDQDYQRSLEIKKANVSGRLNEMLKLSGAEQSGLSIVAVAANPFDMGTEYWLSNLEKFQTLSRISRLQKATTERFQQCGGSHSILLEMQKTIVADVISKEMPVATENFARIEEEERRLRDMNERNHEKLEDMKQRIMSSRSSLTEFVARHFADIILQAKSCGLETFDGFFQREIGADGLVLQTKLEAAFEKRLGPIELEANRSMTSIDADVGVFNTAVGALGKRGLDFVVKNNVINNGTILATRDGVVAATKMVGLDLSKYLKFKPYGAMNLAKGLNGALAILGVALERWDSYEKAKREDEFREGIAQLVSNFEEQRVVLINSINNGEFVENCCVNFKALQKRVMEIDDQLVASSALLKKFRAWKESGAKIEAQLAAMY
ncbi:MAG TPA: LeoA/HP0731 family dynamin-like GTPase [Noviherbaspirillum sp.]|nr:LeoA/HP0731 family dynamin-like GTPase [Noviherbaspirillum sp.]